MKMAAHSQKVPQVNSQQKLLVVPSPTGIPTCVGSRNPPNSGLTMTKTNP
jgi:hypothetical protein